MKANELMIGDWVQFNGSPYVIEEISKKGWVHMTDPVHNLRVQMSTDYILDFIEGIPLTDGILVANGFESNPYSPGNGFHLLSLEVKVNIGDETFYQDCKLSRLNDGKSYRYSDYAGNVITNIEYVHELQHAIRLCGIENEIIIKED